jgi:hypothetical protein
LLYIEIPTIDGPYGAAPLLCHQHSSCHEQNRHTCTPSSGLTIYTSWLAHRSFGEEKCSIIEDCCCIHTEVKSLGILLADLAAAGVGLLEAVARHVQLLGPDVKEGRAQLALEQCRLLEHDVVDLLLGRDDGLSRRVDGQAGVHGGGPANLPRLEAKARVPERAEHPAACRHPPLEQGGALEAPMVVDVPDGVGEPGRRCSYEDDGHMSLICKTRPMSTAEHALWERRERDDWEGGREKKTDHAR